MEEQTQSIVETLSPGLGAAWASGINLYAAILTMGILANMGHLTLPPGLEILTDPLVIAAAGLMYAVEFFADKTPGIDTGWDAIHTFIRIPAGAALAAGAVSGVDTSPAVELAAMLVGGGVAAVTHTTKAGSRALINTSPEPVSNWTASFLEDFAVIGGLWAALNHPWLFLGLFILFLFFIAWLLPKVFRGLKRVFKFLTGGAENTPTEQQEDTPSKT